MFRKILPNCFQSRQYSSSLQPGLLEGIIRFKLTQYHHYVSPAMCNLWIESIRRLNPVTANFALLNFLYPNMLMRGSFGNEDNAEYNPKVCRLCNSADLTYYHALVDCIEANRRQHFVKRHDDMRNNIVDFLETHKAPDFKILTSDEHQGLFQGKIPDIVLQRQPQGKFVFCEVIISDSLSQRGQMKRRKYKEFTDEEVIIFGLTYCAIPYRYLLNQQYFQFKDFLDEKLASKSAIEEFLISLMMELHRSNEEIWKKFSE